MSSQKDITLKDLCGVHLLQGFELTKQKADRYCIESECDVVKFMLDGITYVAVENPDDGYRSYCEGINISHEKPKYSIPDCEVECKMKPNDFCAEHDVLIGIDTHTGLVVFEVGTMYADDYYPCCHFEYHPENMFCNLKTHPVTNYERIKKMTVKDMADFFDELIEKNCNYCLAQCVCDTNFTCKDNILVWLNSEVTE